MTSPRSRRKPEDSSSTAYSDYGYPTVEHIERPRGRAGQHFEQQFVALVKSVQEAVREDQDWIAIVRLEGSGPRGRWVGQLSVPRADTRYQYRQYYVHRLMRTEDAYRHTHSLTILDSGRRRLREKVEIDTLLEKAGLLVADVLEVEFSCRLVGPERYVAEGLPAVALLLKKQLYGRALDKRAEVDASGEAISASIVWEPADLPRPLVISGLDILVLRVVQTKKQEDEPQEADAALQENVRAMWRTEPTDAVVSIWVSGDEGFDIREALGEFAQRNGLTLQDDGPSVRGTWRQRCKLIARAVIGNEVVKEAAEELLERARIETVKKAKAQVDSINTDIVAKLISAIDKHDEAVVVFGPTIIVKHEGTMFVRSVDPVVASKLERMPVLMTNPQAMLDALSGTTEQEEKTRASRQPIQSQLAIEDEHSYFDLKKADGVDG